MASFTEPTAVYNHRFIERHYYHEIIHRGLEATHKSFAIGDKIFEVKKTVDNDSREIYHPNYLAVKTFSESEKVPQVTSIDLITERFKTVPQITSVDSIIDRFKTVLNLPTIRENAKSLDRFNLGRSDNYHDKQKCCRLCHLANKADSKLDEFMNLFPTEDSTLHSYIQSLELRGPVETHEKFYINNLQVKVEVEIQAQIQVKVKVLASLNIGLLTRECKKTSISVSLLDVPPFLENNITGTSKNIERILNDNTTMVRAALAVERWVKATSTLLTDNEQQQYIETNNDRVTQQKAKSAVISDVEDIITITLGKMITIERINPLTKKKCTETKPLKEFITTADSIRDDHPEVALGLLEAIKDKIPQELYERLKLNEQEDSLKVIVARREKAAELVKYIKTLNAAKPTSSQLSQECAISQTPFSPTSEIIQMVQDMDGNIWCLVEKESVLQLLNSPNPRHPFTRRELTKETFKGF